MVRTKNSINYRVSLGQAPKAAAAKSTCRTNFSTNAGQSTPSKSKCSIGAGNSIRIREIPPWQKEITSFFKVKENKGSPAKIQSESHSLMDDESKSHPLMDVEDESHPLMDVESESEPEFDMMQPGPSGT